MSQIKSGCGGKVPAKGSARRQIAFHDKSRIGRI
jgi:hypothetical protein